MVIAREPRSKLLMPPGDWRCESGVGLREGGARWQSVPSRESCSVVIRKRESRTCLWRIDMLSDSIRGRCPSEASGACGAHPAAVKRSDQPTAPRLPAQTATGFIGSAVCRCPLDTPGSTSLGRIRQPLVCDRGLDSGLAIHRNGDWRRVAA